MVVYLYTNGVIIRIPPIHEGGIMNYIDYGDAI